MHRNYQDIACDMLGRSELPDELQVMLNKADERVRDVRGATGECVGGLRSRQSIAAIIAAWEATGEVNVMRHVDAVMKRAVSINSEAYRRDMRNAGAQ